MNLQTYVSRDHRAGESNSLTKNNNFTPIPMRILSIISSSFGNRMEILNRRRNRGRENAIDTDIGWIISVHMSSNLRIESWVTELIAIGFQYASDRFIYVGNIDRPRSFARNPSSTDKAHQQEIAKSPKVACLSRSNWNSILNLTWNLECRLEMFVCWERAVSRQGRAAIERRVYLRSTCAWRQKCKLGDWTVRGRRVVHCDEANCTPLATRIPFPTTHRLIAPVQCYFRQWLNAGSSL